MASIRPSIGSTMPLLVALALPLAATAGRSTGTPSTSPEQAPQQPAVRDLRGILDTGWILQDPGGDGTIDHLEVRIVLPMEPTAAHVAAAADVAARLGYESVALDLGLAVWHRGSERYDVPVISIGASGLPAGAGSSRDAPVEGLAPGQGSITFLEPGPALARGGVAIRGHDATGLLASSAYLAGRYPSIWNPEDEGDWKDVAERLEEFVTARDLPGADIRLRRIVVDAAAPGVTRLEAAVELPDLAAVELVAAALVGDAEEQGAAAVADTASREEDDGPTRADLEFQDLHRLDVRLIAPGTERIVRVRPASPWSTAAGQDAPAPSEVSFTLPELYSVGGLYSDTNQDLVPDGTGAYLAIDGPEAAEALVDLAARIGLETAGARFPIARVVGERDDLETMGVPIVVGVESYGIRRLREEGKLHSPPPAAGEGFVEIVEGAFMGQTAIVIGGGDEEGLSEAVGWAARRAAYIWLHGKGELLLSEVSQNVRRFLQARDAPGQVALALEKLGVWMERASAAGGRPSSIEVELSAERAPAGLEALVTRLVTERFPESVVDVSIRSTGFGVGDTVMVRDFDVPWEVDEVRRAIGSLSSRLTRDRQTSVELRVSEPPEVRAALEEEIRALLAEYGVPRDKSQVTALSAYKQGHSWLEDRVLPRLRGRSVRRIDVSYHTLEESEEVRWQTVAAKTRWLQELYPIDAVLARELTIPDSAVAFHATRRSDPVYTVTAWDSSGTVVLEDSFSPSYVVRPFFDLFPEYEQVRVTTGWLTVVQGIDTLVDRRVVTDPEAFWDVPQRDVYRTLIDYVMNIQDGRPSQSNAPFFDELRVDLRLSEPNHRIGVDEEVVSSLEALHEDIYFETLTLFDLIGDRYGVGGLSYPGRVLPYIDPTGQGLPGHARVTLTGKKQGIPELVVRTIQEGGEPTLQRYLLSPLPVEAPRLLGVVVAAGEDGLRQLLFEVEARDSLDRFEEYRERGSEQGIDHSFLSADLLQGMVGSARRMHEEGFFGGDVAWDRVRQIAFRFRVEGDSLYSRTAVLPRSEEPAEVTPGT